MAENIKSGVVESGERGIVMCNLPQGLTVELLDKNKVPWAVTFNGRNHRRAIDTDTTQDGRWGSTPNVAKEFWDAFVKYGHPAQKNGNIFFVDGDSQEKARDMAESMEDAISTGTNPIDPDKPADGVEPAGADAKDG